MRLRPFLLALLLTTPAVAQQKSPSPDSAFALTAKVPTDAKLKIGKLSNGLTYYIRKNVKPEKRAELRLVVNAGSILEKPNQRGYAHFVEHTAFNGTRHFAKNELVKYLQSIGVRFGADLNAYTSFDETVYILPVPTDTPLKGEEKAMTADMEQALGQFIGEQNPFAEMRLPPGWQTDEASVTFPSVTDFWAKLMQDPNTAVSKVVRITYTVAGQPEPKTYSLYLAYASEAE